MSKRRTIRAFVCLALTLICVGSIVGCADVFLPNGFQRLNVQEYVRFPATSLGEVVTKSIQISNAGDLDLIIRSVELNDPSGVFSLEGLGAGRIPPLSSIEATITYAPRDSISATGEIRIRSNSSEEGTSSTVIQLDVSDPILELRIIPHSVTFGRVPINTTSTKAVRLQNLSEVSVSITDLSPTDSATGFAVSSEYLSALPRTLTPGEEWSFEVVYSPVDEDPVETTLEVQYRADGSDRSNLKFVRLSANPRGPCLAITNEDGFDFGPSLIGETHEEVLTITNCASDSDAPALRVSDIRLRNTLEEPSSDSFNLTVSRGLPIRLQSDWTETFTLTYTPTVLDVVETAWLEIISNDDKKSPLVIEITGIGTDNVCPTAVVDCSVRDTSGIFTSLQRVRALSTIDCSAAGSFDPNGSIAAYTWTLVTPESSATALDSADQATTSFVVDATGRYTVELNVTDDEGVDACEISKVTLEVCECEEIRVELFWTTPGDSNPHDTGPGTGSDLDLHFLKVDRGCWNGRWDCHWNNSGPGWGRARDTSDDPHLDRNDTDGWGPEIIYLRDPEEGTYRIGVEYTDAGDFGASIATVLVHANGSLAFEDTRELSAENDFWEVADIEWPSGSVTTLGREFRSIEGADCE